MMHVASHVRRGIWFAAAFVLVAGTYGLSTVLGGTHRAYAAGLALDKVVSAHSTGSTNVTSPAFTTTQSNELLVAFVTSDGNSSGGSQSFSGITGGSLTWRLRQRTNTQAGTAENLTTVAPNGL